MVQDKARLLEEYLVAGTRLGDRAAAGKLAALRGPRLFAHAMRLLSDRADAEDVVQDAWIEILRGLKGLNDERAFPAWAYRIVTRRAAKLIDRKVQYRNAADAFAAEAESITPEKGPVASDATSVRAAIDTLPPDQGATIALFYLEDMTVTEVAVALDVPSGTVKTRLMHARRKLHDVLEGGSDEQA